MALTADLDYQTVNPTDIDTFTAGAADTLYKGAIINIGTNGFAKVAADVASEYPAGINTRQVVAAGANAETVDVESGTFRLKKQTQHKFTVNITDDTAANNAKFNSKYFVIYSGTTGYYVWFNVAAGGVDPAPSGLTGVEIAVTAINTNAQIAALIKTALEALGGGGGAVFSVSVAGNIATVTVTARGACSSAGNGTSGAVVLVTNTVLGTAVQADVGVMFYAKADDGVVYSSEVSNVGPLGMCVGVSTDNYLWIKTNLRAV